MNMPKIDTNVMWTMVAASFVGGLVFWGVRTYVAPKIPGAAGVAVNSAAQS